ncbi:M10 family metallopeptidase C-terminal domain-containing protein [Microvirga sp. TS319]|uniref:M10 family metallopeptidase C-terminal domain-containing protein n=1 Tax=Microvirga sp. TS319 TaxID=3241165 RepID=UPI00351A32E5
MPGRISLIVEDPNHRPVELMSLKPPNPEPEPEEPPPPPDFPSKILDLAPDGIRTTFGTETLIDIGSDATIAPGNTPIKKLQVHLSSELNWFEHIGLRENNHVTATDGGNRGSVITVDGVEIGSISTSSDQWAMIFHFNENATPERVQELIRCLTYTNTHENLPMYSGDIDLILVDVSGESWDEYANVTVAPVGEMVLTAGADTYTGREGDDVFYAFESSMGGDVIAGGEGFDTLSLVGGGLFFLNTMTGLLGIEKIQGSREEDIIVVSAGQLAAVQVLDGGTDPDHGSDFLQLQGSYFDLTAKEIVNFAEIGLSTEGATVVVDEVHMAKLVWGREQQGETLILSQGTLTEAERLQIHRQGIDTIVTLADGTTTKHEAPTITGLDQDHVTLNAPKVFIDAGRNVTIESDDGLMGYLDIEVVDTGSNGGAGTNDDSEREDILDIETSDRITLSEGLRDGSRVMIGGIDIGAIANYSPVLPSVLGFTFNENATPDLVEELVQAVTYRNANGRIFESKQIHFNFGDAGFRSSEISISIDPETNVAPTAIALSATTIAELSRNGSVIGELTAQDTNFGETFTYSLTNDAGGRFAIVGDKLVVKHGVKLDFEDTRSHTVKIKATDALGLSFEKTFTIRVSDVNPEAATGTSGHDKIVGGAGRDRLTGAGGADTLLGGRGDDVLTGGSGRDSLTGGDGKDLFVFHQGDVGLGSARRDVVTDFRHGVDRIDISGIDADATTRTDNRFTALLSAGSTFTKAGQLRYDAKTGVLSGNTDSDARSEFEIVLKNKPAVLTLSDLVL